MEEIEREYLKGAKPSKASRVIEDREVQGILWLGPKGLFFQSVMGRDRHHNCLVPWMKIDSVEVDGADALQSRVTLTRFALIGFFAFALKKKTGEVFAYVESGSRQFLFKLPKKSAPEGRALFAPYRTQMEAGAKSREQADAARTSVSKEARIRCEFCARMIPAASSKCPECGATLRQVLASDGPPSSTETKTCPYCAEEIKAQAIKCKHCGERLGT